MKKALLLNGPNLNFLSIREVDIYGSLTLDEINARLAEYAREIGFSLEFFQSNHEGALIDKLQEAREWVAGVVFNPGAYTHTSIALHDAIKSIHIPVVEVHLSNILAREDFRKTSLTAPACAGVVSGFGWQSYKIGLYALSSILEGK